MTKEIVWVGDSLKVVQGFPQKARQEIGSELRAVQRGQDPESWKPMKSIGAGVREIRVNIDSNQFRAIYIAKFIEAVYVLHAFQKKSQKTSSKDLKLAAKRYRQLINDRKNE